MSSAFPLIVSGREVSRFGLGGTARVATDQATAWPSGETCFAALEVSAGVSGGSAASAALPPAWTILTAPAILSRGTTAVLKAIDGCEVTTRAWSSSRNRRGLTL